MKLKKKTPRCLICGCTESRACPEGCYWVIKNKLCSACHVGNLKALQDVLKLVSLKASLKVINSWPLIQRAKVLRWASATYYSAADNPVRIPKKPRVLSGLAELK